MRNHELLQSALRLYNGAQEPDLQEPLAGFGLTSDKLQEFKDLTDQVRNAQSGAESLLSLQKIATRKRDRKYGEIQPLDINLRRNLRLIDPQSPILNMLGMQTRYTTVHELPVQEEPHQAEPQDPSQSESPAGGGGEVKPVSRQVSKASSKSMTYRRTRLMVIMDNIPKLPQDVAAKLEAYGWGQEAFGRLTALIETYLQLCIEQEKAARAYQQHQQENRGFRVHLERDYRIYRNNILQQCIGHPLETKLKNIAA